MTSTVQDTATVTAWPEQSIEVEGRRWTYHSSGAGDPVLVLDPPGEPASFELFDAFTSRWRVLATQLPTTAESVGATDLAALLAALDITTCAVIARGSAAAPALRLAAEHADLVDRLVLESPVLDPTPSAGGVDTGLVGTGLVDTGLVDTGLVDVLQAISAPTLVLLGQRTDAAAPERTGVFRLLPGSTLGLVYDSGADIRSDRPAAYAATVSDYLERGQAFIVNVQSTVIHG